MFIELLIISIITIYIVDLSGFITSIKWGLYKWLNPDLPFNSMRFKPFDCSLCMTFWIGLLWLFLCHSMTLSYLLWVCTLSYFSDVIGLIMGQIKDNIIVLLNKLYL